MLPSSGPEQHILLSPLQLALLARLRAVGTTVPVAVAVSYMPSEEEALLGQLGVTVVRPTIGSLVRFAGSKAAVPISEYKLSVRDLYLACVEAVVHNAASFFTLEAVGNNWRDLVKPLFEAIARDLRHHDIGLNEEASLCEAFIQKARTSPGRFPWEFHPEWETFKNDCKRSHARVLNDVNRAMPLVISSGDQKSGLIRQRIAVVVRDGLMGAALEHITNALCARPVRVLRATVDTAHKVPAFIARQGPAAIFLELSVTSSCVSEAVVQLGSGPAARRLCEARCRARPFEEDELQEAMAAFFHAQDLVRARLHDVANDLRIGRAVAELHTDLLRLRDDLRLFGWTEEADLAKRMADLSGSVSVSQEEILATFRGMLAELQARLFPTRTEGSSEESADLPPDKPPLGFGTILAADDNDFVPGWTSFLRDLGYGVDIVTSLENARETLLVNPGDVFVCDLQWGNDPLAGTELMQLAYRSKRKCKLVVAISAAPLDVSDVQGSADRALGGIDAKSAKGAQQLHRIIWEWATRKD